MANKWFVEPEKVRIDLVYKGEPFWIQVKKQLNMGEKRRLETAGFRGMSAPSRQGEERETKIDVDFRSLSFARTEMYLTDWSLADDHGNKIPLGSKRDTLEQLDPDVYEIIEDAISAHVEAREAEKKAESGAASPSETSA